MKIRVRHTFDFGAARTAVGPNLRRPAAWDAARSAPGAFALPESRADWERLADRDDLRARARDVAAIVRTRGARTLCSHGVGTAALELAVHRADPSLHLVCTDYAPRTVERLRRLFPEAEVVLRSLGDPDPPHADLHLMHRIDAELPDDEWRQVFARLREPILFVPNTLLDIRGAVREIARGVMRRRRVSSAGWFRNEAAMRSLWQEAFSDRRVDVGGAPGFLLEPR